MGSVVLIVVFPRSGKMGIPVVQFELGVPYAGAGLEVVFVERRAEQLVAACGRVFHIALMGFGQKIECVLPFGIFGPHILAH
jgi:hypothetical protein